MKIHDAMGMLTVLLLQHVLLFALPTRAAGQAMPGEVDDIRPAEKEHVADTRDRHVGVALGAGIPYGTLGGNVDYLLGDHYAPMIGVGSTTTKAGMGFSMGLRYYPFGKENAWRWRLTGLYGTIAALEFVGGPLTAETIEGAVVGMGFLKLSGARKSGWEFDVLYLVEGDKIDRRLEELRDLGYGGEVDMPLGDFKLSLGLRLLF